MADASPRDDLAALISPIWRLLMATEREVAARHDLTMWGYAALHALGGRTVRGQAVLATALGIDKTRLIPVLDDLQDRGFIVREPDPDDRRAHVLSLTSAGRRIRARVQREIQDRENRTVLARLSAAERADFLRLLESVSGVARRAAPP